MNRNRDFTKMEVLNLWYTRVFVFFAVSQAGFAKNGKGSLKTTWNARLMILTQIVILCVR
jgi:hypothetical protein